MIIRRYQKQIFGSSAMARLCTPKPILLVVMAIMLAAQMSPATGFAWRLFAGRYDLSILLSIFLSILFVVDDATLFFRIDH